MIHPAEMPTDLQIARKATLRPMEEVANEIGVGPHLLEPYGDSVAKIKLDAMEELR
jgi:formate--tetrahydrofolate ligase